MNSIDVDERIGNWKRFDLIFMVDMFVEIQWIFEHPVGSSHILEDGFIIYVSPFIFVAGQKNV